MDLDDEFHDEGRDSMDLGFRLLTAVGLLLLGENCAGAEPKEGQMVTKEEQAGRSDISADEEVVFYPKCLGGDERQSAFSCRAGATWRRAFSVIRRAWFVACGHPGDWAGLTRRNIVREITVVG